MSTWIRTSPGGETARVAALASVLAAVSSLAMLVAPVTVTAQAIPLSLEEALLLAARNNPGYLAARNDSAAAWGVREAYGAFLPTAGVSGGARYEDRGSQVERAEETLTLARTRASAGVGIPLDAKQAEVELGRARVRDVRPSGFTRQVGDDSHLLERGRTAYERQMESCTLKVQTDQSYVSAVYTFHETLADLEAAVGRPLRSAHEPGGSLEGNSR